MLACFTNQSDNDVNYVVPNSGFSEGTKVCNIFYPNSDCQTVGDNNSVNVYLLKGEVKVFVPEGLAMETHERHMEMLSLVQTANLQE